MMMLMYKTKLAECREALVLRGDESYLVRHWRKLAKQLFIYSAHSERSVHFPNNQTRDIVSYNQSSRSATARQGEHRGRNAGARRAYLY
jgi:hypothetical protein